MSTFFNLVEVPLGFLFLGGGCFGLGDRLLGEGLWGSFDSSICMTLSLFKGKLESCFSQNAD
jgi:hypothetical protein